MFFSGQGYEDDDSDVEWEDHITWYYGAQARVRPNALRQTNLDPGIGMTEMVVESFAIADRIREEVAAETVPEGLGRPQEPQAGVHEGEDDPAEHESVPFAATDHVEEVCGGASPVVESQHPAGEDDTTMGADVRNGDRNVHVAESGDSSGDEGGHDWGDSEDEDTDATVAALEEAATTPLFPGSDYSSMGTTYILLSGGKLHGVSDTYLDELFRVLSTTILPKPNTLPKSYREASEYLRKLGHTYKSIDSCPNNCRLYRNELKDARVCPECRAPRKRRAGRSEFLSR